VRFEELSVQSPMSKLKQFAQQQGIDCGQLPCSSSAALYNAVSPTPPPPPSCLCPAALQLTTTPAGLTPSSMLSPDRHAWIAPDNANPAKSANPLPEQPCCGSTSAPWRENLGCASAWFRLRATAPRSLHATRTRGRALVGLNRGRQRRKRSIARAVAGVGSEAGRRLLRHVQVVALLRKRRVCLRCCAPDRRG
jgi:hypothetical protein